MAEHSEQPGKNHTSVAEKPIVDDFSSESARKAMREVILYVMLNLGKFEPHTREEAEKRLDAYYSMKRQQSDRQFDPSI